MARVQALSPRLPPSAPIAPNAQHITLERERAREKSEKSTRMGETLAIISLLLLLLFLSISSLLPQSRAIPMAIIVPDPSSSSSSSSSSSPPQPLAAPPPTAGGALPALPSDRRAAAAAAAPSSFSAASAPAPSSPSGAAAPEGGGGVPLISSNPAVPIPTGVTDSATILPLPSPGVDQNPVAGSGPSIKEGTAMMVSGLVLFSIGLVVESCFFSLGTYVVSSCSGAFL